jgi:hypothetical protein
MIALFLVIILLNLFKVFGKGNSVLTIIYIYFQYLSCYMTFRLKYVKL